MTSSATGPIPDEVSKPQSVPAITRVGSGLSASLCGSRQLSRHYGHRAEFANPGALVRHAEREPEVVTPEQRSKLAELN